MQASGASLNAPRLRHVSFHSRINAVQHVQEGRVTAQIHNLTQPARRKGKDREGDKGHAERG